MRFGARRRLGVSAQDVPDITQEVLLVVMRRLNTIAPEKERAFVVGVTARVVANYHRARRRSPFTLQSLAVEQVDPAPDPERSADLAVGLELLERALAYMTDKQRVVFVLIELEGLSALEVSQQLGVPVPAVTSRVRRAREALARFVESAQGQTRRASPAFAPLENES